MAVKSHKILLFSFLSDPGYLVSDLWVRVSLTKRGCADLTDLTLSDQDTNSILTDHANRALQGNVGMCHLSKAAHFLTGV